MRLRKQGQASPTPPPVTFETVIPNPKLKLLDQLREVMRLKHYSIRAPVCASAQSPHRRATAQPGQLWRRLQPLARSHARPARGLVHGCSQQIHRIFIRTCQHVDGSTDVPKPTNARVPSPAP